MRLKLLKKQAPRAMKELLSDARYLFLYDHRMPTLYEGLVALRDRHLGRMIRLEASSVCQLKCPACSTAKGKNRRGVIGWGFLKFKHFKQLLLENPDITLVELSNWGEIFLNPDIDRIMGFAKKRGVRLKAANGVNLNTVSDTTLRNIVRYGFAHVSVSIDGASQETYRLYRKRGSFNRVIRNIKRINYFKKKYQTHLPKLSWQFVIFGHNEHELPKARAMAEELGMEFRPKLNHTPGFSPVQDRTFVRREGGFGAASRGEYAVKKRRAYSRPCTQLWDSPQINWDGKLLGCCVNKYGDFGNVFQTGFRACLASERFTYAKEMVLGLKPPREDIPCVHCKVYKTAIGGELLDRPRKRGQFAALKDLTLLTTRYLIQAIKQIPPSS